MPQSWCFRGKSINFVMDQLHAVVVGFNNMWQTHLGAGNLFSSNTGLIHSAYGRMVFNRHVPCWSIEEWGYPLSDVFLRFGRTM